VTGPQLLIDAFDRIKGVVHHAADGLDEDRLAARLDPQANSIGWLIWHLTRIQDDHVADVAGRPQVYVAGGWWERLGRPFEVGDHGYGQSSDEVTLGVRLVSVVSDDLQHAGQAAFIRGVLGRR